MYPYYTFVYTGMISVYIYIPLTSIYTYTYIENK